ncbi:MAG: hypothetical protein SPG64_03925 [Candidatus Enteromonas sp.]|nr:hypothetical protein [Candidatus Enteromonas sp.]
MPKTLLVSLLTALATTIVLILVFVAKTIFVSGDFTLSCRRHVFLKKSDIRVNLIFENIGTGKHSFSSFGLLGKKGETYEPIAEMEGAPILLSNSSEIEFKEGKAYLNIPNNVRAEVTISFRVIGQVDWDTYDEFYMVLKEKEKTRYAKFEDFWSSNTQRLHFKKVKKKH